jgi:hypothetical protein
VRARRLPDDTNGIQVRHVISITSAIAMVAVFTGCGGGAPATVSTAEFVAKALGLTGCASIAHAQINGKNAPNG